MGTAIDLFFAHQTKWSPEALQQTLDDLCAPLEADLTVIRSKGRFSNCTAAWTIWREDFGTSDVLGGEGTTGLMINVYDKVIYLTSVERIAAMYDEAYGVLGPLRRVLCSLAVSLAQPTLIAVAASGFGDTDAAEGIAYEKGSFDAVCEELRKVIGPPSSSWQGIGELGWYLGPPVSV